MHGIETAQAETPLPPPQQREIVPAAIELLSAPEGHWKSLREEGT
jgi:hypothetical protein